MKREKLGSNGDINYTTRQYFISIPLLKFYKLGKPETNELLNCRMFHVAIVKLYCSDPKA